MKKPKGIIVGVGRAGTHLHFGSLTANGAEILAFVDINKDAAKKTAKKFGIDKYYTTLEEALSENKVDFVSICTTAKSHFLLSKLALQKGCHVLLEKPMVSDLAEANKLLKIIESTGRSVCVVHNHKFYPNIQDAKKVIENGQIGDIMHIYREMSFFREKVRMMEPGHWAHNIPGGRLFEANPHNLYLLYNFVGPFELLNIYPRKISNRWSQANIDEFLADFKTDKTTISLKMSINATKQNDYKNYSPNFLIITGTKGVLIVTYHKVKLLSSVIKNRLLYRSLPKLIKETIIGRTKKYPRIYNTEGQLVNIGVGSGHYYFMKEYLGFLLGKYKEPPVSWEEAYFVEEMNEKMGKEVERKLNAN